MLGLTDWQDIKLLYLHEAALHLDKNDSTIAEHVGPVLTEVNDNITVRLSAGAGAGVCRVVCVWSSH